MFLFSERSKYKSQLWSIKNVVVVANIPIFLKHGLINILRASSFKNMHSLNASLYTSTFITIHMVWRLISHTIQVIVYVIVLAYPSMRHVCIVFPVNSQ